MATACLPDADRLTDDLPVYDNDDADREQSLVDEWTRLHRPTNAFEEWLIKVMAVNSARVSRGFRDRYQREAYYAHRAALVWDDDRRLDAEELGARLSKRPQVVAARLARFKQGCEWLIDAWKALGGPLDKQGEWTSDQVSRAHDLLGTPAASRERIDAPAEVVSREIERLEALIEDGLSKLDETERSLAAHGIFVRTPRDVAESRRHEKEYFRQAQWAYEQLTEARRAQAESSPAPKPSAATAPASNPARPTAPSSPVVRPPAPAVSPVAPPAPAQPAAPASQAPDRKMNRKQRRAALKRALQSR
jgi:hypothetical protein